jgi:magnesium-transporting ATPase (P-type)
MSVYQRLLLLPHLWLLVWRMNDEKWNYCQANEDCRNIRSATVICIDKTGTITENELS